MHRQVWDVICSISNAYLNGTVCEHLNLPKNSFSHEAVHNASLHVGDSIIDQHVV